MLTAIKSHEILTWNLSLSQSSTWQVGSILSGTSVLAQIAAYDLQNGYVGKMSC